MPLASAQTLPAGPAASTPQASRSRTTILPEPAQTLIFAPSTTTPEPLALTGNDLSIKPSLSTTYDDNIFRVDTARQPKQDELYISPQIAAQLDRVLGKQQISVGGSYQYDIFTMNSDRSRPRFAVNGRLTRSLGAFCSATPYGEFRRERSDYGDINTQVDNTQRTTRYGALLACPRPVGLFPSLAYERFTTRNSSLFDYADQSTDTYIAGIGYRKPSFGQLLLYYRRDNTDRPTLSIENNVDRFGVSFSRSISSLLAADVDLNWISLHSTDPQLSDYKGLGWRVELSSRAIPLTRLTATTTRTIVNDSLITAGYGVLSTYALGAQVRLSDLTSAALTGEYRMRDFRQNAALVRAGLSSDDSVAIRAEIARKLSDRLRLRLTGIHATRSTDTGVSEFKANQITAGADFSF